MRRVAPKRKALLRCLIEKIILKRIAPDLIQTRIVWKGGQTTTFEVCPTVGAFSDLSGAQEMERLVVKLFEEGNSDKQIAQYLTDLGTAPRGRRTCSPPRSRPSAADTDCSGEVG